MEGERPLILYAEDDPDHAELVMRGLARAGEPCDVVHVFDGEEVMAYLDGSRPRPQLILLDLRLPKLDGLQVLERVRADARLAGIPVVVLSTSASPGDIRRAYQHHVNSYLVKPIEFAALARLMTDLRTYWLQWNVAPTPAS